MRLSTWVIMAAPFSEEEKANIRETLMEKGLQHFSAQGIGRARIEDICRDAGISKGSFYAFFSSKEALFFAIGEAHREANMQAIFSLLDDIGSRNTDWAQPLFDRLLDMVEGNNLMKIMTDPGDMARLKRKLTPHQMQADAQADAQAGAAFYSELAKRFNRKKLGARVDAAFFANAMTLIAALVMQKSTYPPDAYKSAKGLLCSMFVQHLRVGAE